MFKPGDFVVDNGNRASRVTDHTEHCYGTNRVMRALHSIKATLVVVEASPDGMLVRARRAGKPHSQAWDYHTSELDFADHPGEPSLLRSRYRPREEK